MSNSRLGSLFGSTTAPADNNDSLKYTAPTQPKKSSTQAPPTSTVSSGGQTGVAAVTTAATPAPASGASRVVVSAAVRLYKLNASTGGYEAHAGGSPLGCVIVGGGINYQLLIYNGQKQPQATCPISGNFTYNLRDLYVSFSDAQRNNWSILFDNVDILTTFARALMAILCHVKCHAPSSDTTPTTIKGSLPALPDADTSGTSPLSAGVVAGVSYRAWEVAGSPADHPVEVMSQAPFLQATAADLAKIKVGGASDDPIGGLGAALGGCHKGDRLIIGIPTGTAYSNCAGDMSARCRPAMWVIVELEIVKVKSDKEKKDKKKDKKKDVVEPIVPTQQQQPFSATTADHNHHQQEQVEHAERRDSKGDLSSRMAALAQQSGGAQTAFLAAAVTGSPQHHHHQQQTPPQQQAAPQQSLPPPQQQMQQHSQQNQQQQQQGGYHTPPQQQQYQQQPGDGYSQQQQGHYQQPQQQHYAVALVEGQEARSYYLSDEQSTSSYIQQKQQSDLHHRPDIGNGMSSQKHHQVEHFGQIQQTLLSLQTSLMSLHGKVDGIGAAGGSLGGMGGSLQHQMQLIQQQQQLAAMMRGGFSGAAGQGTSDAMLLQQMLGGNLSAGAGGNDVRLRGKEIVESVQALVADHEKCTVETAALKQQIATGTSTHVSRASTANEERMTKMEDKIEALMARNEKLMNEKSDLWEKHATLMESSSESSSKLSRMQRELDAAVRDRDESEASLKTQRDRISAMRVEIEELRDTAALASSSAKTSKEDQDRVLSLQQTLATVTSDRDRLIAALESVEKAHSNALVEKDNEWTSKLERSTNDLIDALKKLETKHDDTLKEHEEEWEAERVRLKRHIAERDDDISDLKEEALRAAARVADSSSGTSASHLHAEEKLQLEKEIADLHERRDNETKRADAAERALLQSQEIGSELESTKVALANAISNSDMLSQEVITLRQNLVSAENGGGKQSPSLNQEQINQLMQDIYASLHNMFSPNDSDDDEAGGETSYTSQDVLKRCRRVLKQVASEFAAKATTVETESV